MGKGRVAQCLGGILLWLMWARALAEGFIDVLASI